MSNAPPIIDIDVDYRREPFALSVKVASAALSNAFFGHSGAGKTTLINLIAGLVRPDRGRITINGRTLVDTEKRIHIPKHKRRVGLVFQDAQLLPHLTVEQNIAFAEWFAGDEPQKFERRAVIDILGIEHLLARRPAELSGGEKQRAALARALLSKPEVLLLDEPLASLDDARRLEILPFLERIRDEFHVPLVYVTHRREEVLRLAAWTAIINDGRIVASGPTESVLQSEPPAA